MSDAAAPSGQFDFLNALRKGRATVTLYLVNGIRLQGRIASFDRYSVLLHSRDGEVLIQNHAISTIGRDAGPPRRSREGGARDHAPRGDRPPRESQPPRGQWQRSAATGGVGPMRDVAERPLGPRPEARPPRPAAPTVTIVRKGFRRVRSPADAPAPTDPPATSPGGDAGGNDER